MLTIYGAYSSLIDLGFNGHFTWKGYLQLEKAIAAPEENFDLVSF